MKKLTLFIVFFFVYFVLQFSGCGGKNNDSVTPTPEVNDFPPGYEWGGGDWPSLKSPEFGQEPIFGSPVPAVTAIFQGNFLPRLTNLQGNAWTIQIKWVGGIFGSCQLTETKNYEIYWSCSLPTTEWRFTSLFCDNTFNSPICWEPGSVHKFELVKNGAWLLQHDNEDKDTIEIGDNTYYITRNFTLAEQPDVYLTMSRNWVKGSGTSDDVTRSEGHTSITVTHLSGVIRESTTEMGVTLGLDVGYTTGGLGASISATFEYSTSHSVTFEDQLKIEETREYDIPANERWRMITVYGVERYYFSDASGNNWESDALACKTLGQVDNTTRTVLMLVKYISGSSKPYSTEFIENAAYIK